MPFGCTSGSSRRRCQSSGQTSLNRRIETGFRSRPRAKRSRCATKPFSNPKRMRPPRTPAAAAIHSPRTASTAICRWMRAAGSEPAGSGAAAAST